MERRLWRRFDYILLLVTLALIGLGLMMIASATRGVPGEDLVRRQAIFAAIGLVVMFAVAAIDYRVFGGHFGLAIYLILLAGLIAVILYGRVLGGSRGWFALGPFYIQPAEVGKVLVVLVMARYLSRYETRLRQLPYLLAAISLLIPPVVLIYLQPDLGGAVIVLMLGLTLIWLGGMRWRHLTMLLIIGAILAPTIWASLSPYMRTRILIFLNPGSNPDASYNIRQALISIGAGGLIGQGLGHGSQSQLHFLQVRHTDFIFSVLAEELGFIGATSFLLLIGVMLFRLLRIADLARDAFGRLIACGVAFIIFAQTLINVGMNLQLLPATGITLPFVSYGGSSLITLMLGLGLAQSVSMRHKKLEFR
jgi:rod shape determining protein RodA